MEIGKFKLAKADLVRPPRKPIQEQIIPKEKPYTKEVFQTEVEPFIKGFIGGFPKNEMTMKLQSILDKAVEKGALSVDEGTTYMRDRKQQLLDFVKQNPGQTLPELTRENFAFGTEKPITLNNDLGNIQDASLEESTTGPGGYPMTAGLSVLPNAYDTVKKATDFIQSADITPAKAKKVVLDFFKQRQPYGGANQKKDYSPEKKFLSVLKSYMNKFNPTLTGAAEDLGISRNTLKGISERINKQEIGQRTSNLGFDIYSQAPKVPEPVNGIEFKDMTTLMKRDPDQFKVLRKKKDEFLNPESIGHYLGIKFARDDKGIRTGIGKYQYDQLSEALRDLNVKKNKQGEYSVNDAINKLLDKNKSKIIKGERKSDRGLGRYKVDSEFDPELFKLRNNIKTRISNRSQGLDTYLPNAVDDVGHPFSLTKSQEKYKKLFKDSNINQINTLVYQDNFINTQLFKNSGYEKKYEKMFDKLLNIQNKKVTPQIQNQLLEIKKDMNDNYNYIQNIIKDPKLLDQYINKNAKIADKKFINYLTNQGDRVQKIDIKIPKVGDKFKSEDIFVDMSVVNPKYIMGYINNINPNAKKFKDLSLSEQELYRNNVMQQNAEIVSEYYKKAKFPEEDIEAVKETVGMEYAKGGRVGFKEGTPKQPIFSKGAASQLAKIPLANPLGILTSSYLLGGSDALDPRTSEGRITLGAEAAFAPGLVRGSQEIVRKMSPEKRRAVQKLLNLGASPLKAIKYARALSPIGIATLLGEGIFQGGKYMLERKKMLESLTDEQRDELLRKEKQEAVGQMRRGDPEAFEGIMAANGGLISRAGFADGPEDPSKRKFMKIMGGLASLPIVGRFFDIAQVAEKAAPAVVETFKNAPPHFMGLVNKIRALGKIVEPKKMGVSEDRFSNIYEYGDYKMFEGKDGQIEISKDRLMATDYGDAKVSEEYMSYNPKSPKFNKKGELTGETEPQYDEYTAYADQDGKMKDVVDGVEPSTIDDGTYSKEELEQLIIEQVEQNLKKGKK